jgi:hypothetical protein
MRVPVLFEYDDYEHGQRLGYILSIFMLGPGEWDSGQVGEIFWVAPETTKENQ